MANDVKHQRERQPQQDREQVAIEKKSWSAPLCQVVSIADVTENMLAIGNDGLGTSSFS